MSLGENIKRFRKKRGLTQAALADLTDVRPITIRKYESGEREPNLKILNKLSEALEVDIDKLLKEDKKTTLLNKKTGELIVVDTPSIETEESKDKLKLTSLTADVITEIEGSIQEYLAVISPAEKIGANKEKIDELVNKVNELINFEIFKEKNK